MRMMEQFKFALLPAALFYHQSLLAEETNDSGADPQTILKRACVGQGNGVISYKRLAEAIVHSSNILPSDLPAPFPGGSLPSYMYTIQTSPAGPPSNKHEKKIYYSIDLLEELLASGRTSKGEPARLVPNPINPSKGQQKWLFKPGTSVRVICGEKAGKEELTLVERIGKVQKSPLFVVRAKPEDFGLAADERKKADSFKLSYTKKWEVDDEGEEKIKTDWNIKGAIGLRLHGQDIRSNPLAASTYALAAYERKKSRTRPFAPLADGERRNKDDTNVLAVGVISDSELTKNDSEKKLFANAEISYIFNFVEKSQKLRTRVLFEPFLDLDEGNNGIPLCSFGRGFPIGILDLRTRCNFQIDLEAAIQTKQGLADPNEYDDYLATGVQFGMELFGPTGSDSQLLGSVSYRILPVISGIAPDIRRFEASLKQRFWTFGKGAVDLGFNYVNGNNALTLEDEKELSFELGLLF